MTTLHRSKSYAMLSERLQTTLYKENVPFNVNGLCNLGHMQCFSRGSKQHFTGKKSGNSGNVVWTISGHPLYICIYQVLHVKKNIKLLAARHSTQQPVKPLVRHCLKKSISMYVYVYICVTVRNEETKSWYLKFKSSVKTLYKV